MLILNSRKDCEKMLKFLELNDLLLNYAIMISKTSGKPMNNAMLPNPSNVDGASRDENVKSMWLHHYQSLLNSIPGSPANIKKINEYCSNVHFNDQMIVSVKEIQDYDSVSKEHFKYANEKLHIAAC